MFFNQHNEETAKSHNSDTEFICNILTINQYQNCLSFPTTSTCTSVKCLILCLFLLASSVLWSFVIFFPTCFLAYWCSFCSLSFLSFIKFSDLALPLGLFSFYFCLCRSLFHCCKCCNCMYNQKNRKPKVYTPPPTREF